MLRWLNLDKCIGCHTCSVTCKNVWTNREGMEYAWFNNVETKPVSLYPRIGRTRKSGRRLERKANGKIEPRIGGKWRILANIFANPDLPEIDDYYEPFTFDYEHLQKAPETCVLSDGSPAFADHRERMEKIEWARTGRKSSAENSPSARRTPTSRASRRRSTAVRKHLMMYLPRPVRALPQSGLRRSLPVGAIYKREEDGIPDRPGEVPRLAHVRVRLPLQEDLLQLVERQIRESASSAIRASRRASRPSAPRPASGRIRYLASSCTTPTRSRRLPACRTTRISMSSSSRSSSIPMTRGDRAGAKGRQSRSVARKRPPFADLEDGDGVEGRLPAAS